VDKPAMPIQGVMKRIECNEVKLQAKEQKNGKFFVTSVQY
jgi:hypothetical protein